MMLNQDERDLLTKQVLDQVAEKYIKPIQAYLCVMNMAFASIDKHKYDDTINAVREATEKSILLVSQKRLLCRCLGRMTFLIVFPRKKPLHKCS